MRAVVLPEYGPPEKLVVREVPAPAPGPGEIAVRVAAASVNPIDWKLRSGAYQKFRQLEMPAILGRDAAGEVSAVGAGVTAFQVGQKVLGLVNHAYAELVVAPESSWAPLPAGLDLVQAGALPLAVLTGAQLVENAAEARAGETVLVTGATGSVGRAAVFAARKRGAKVYAGVRGKHAAEAAKLGAAGVVVLEDDGALERLPALDALCDTVGGPTTQRLLGKVKSGGRVASVVGEPAGAKERGLSVRAFMAREDAKRLAELAASAAAGELVIPVEKTMPLEQAAQAHALAEKGGIGKLVLTP